MTFKGRVATVAVLVQTLFLFSSVSAENKTCHDYCNEICDDYSSESEEYVSCWEAQGGSCCKTFYSDAGALFIFLIIVVIVIPIGCCIAVCACCCSCCCYLCKITNQENSSPTGVLSQHVIISTVGTTARNYDTNLHQTSTSPQVVPIFSNEHPEFFDSPPQYLPPPRYDDVVGNFEKKS